MKLVLAFVLLFLPIGVVFSREVDVGVEMHIIRLERHEIEGARGDSIDNVGISGLRRIALMRNFDWGNVICHPDFKASGDFVYFIVKGGWGNVLGFVHLVQENRGFRIDDIQALVGVLPSKQFASVVCVKKEYRYLAVDPDDIVEDLQKLSEPSGYDWKRVVATSKKKGLNDVYLVFDENAGEKHDSMSSFLGKVWFRYVGGHSVVLGEFGFLVVNK
jgi:hypothetical protein